MERIGRDRQRLKARTARAASCLLFMACPIRAATPDNTPVPPEGLLQYLLNSDDGIKTEAISPGEHMTIMTYNIKSGERGIKGIAKVINRQDPDIVFLNEVSMYDPQQPNYLLSKLTKMQMFFGHSTTFYNGAFGNAILTKLPVLSQEVIPLGHYPGYEDRSLLIAQLLLKDKSLLTVATTHLDPTESTELPNPAHPTVRQQQAKLALDTLSRFNPERLIVGGDLNAPPNGEIPHMFEKYLYDSFTGTPLYTTPTSPDRVHRIDYIFLPYAWEVEKVKVVGGQASDHEAGVAITVLR